LGGVLGGPHGPVGGDPGGGGFVDRAKVAAAAW